MHWPFCDHICPFCDFNKYHNSISIQQDQFSKAFQIELNYFLDWILNNNKNLNLNDLTFKSVYFGGGTPSIANVKQRNFDIFFAKF